MLQPDFNASHFGGPARASAEADLQAWARLESKSQTTAADVAAACQTRRDARLGRWTEATLTAAAKLAVWWLNYRDG